ncbi:MAG: hypothetical protein KH284_13920 [Clostridiales bacterium]|nr:hypothetical protein [Clostridiales bacterium]
MSVGAKRLLPHGGNAIFEEEALKLSGRKISNFLSSEALKKCLPVQSIPPVGRSFVGMQSLPYYFLI